TINKGSNAGFAKLQQDLPEGFTAIEDNNNGATFAFNNQSVKFIWIPLPADKEFKVSYKVTVAAGISGAQIIAGKFSFVSDNVKQTVQIAPATITITAPEASQPAVIAAAPKTEVTPTTAPVAEKVKPVATTPMVAPPTAPIAPASSGEPSTIECFRTTTSTAKSPSEFPAEVTIKKGNLSGFAKFIETLPVGLSATVIEAKGAAFSFVDQKVKFVWGTLPTETELKISYKINVAPNMSGDQIIEGIFSFIENDQTKKFVLPQTSIKVGATETTQPIASAPKSITESAKPVAIATTPTPPIASVPTAPTTISSTIKPKKENVATALSASAIPSSQGKVNYKVQILALRRNKEVPVVASLLNVTETIEPEQHACC